MKKIMLCLIVGAVSSVLALPVSAQGVAPTVVEGKVVLKKPSLTFYFYDG